MRECWINEYERSNGGRYFGPSWSKRRDAAKSAHPFLRLIGRWKITLKEPRDA